MKSQWMTDAAGVVYGQKDRFGVDTKLLIDVYHTHVHVSGDIWMDAENMECLAAMLKEGAAELRSRQRAKDAVDEAFRKALGR